MMKLWAMLLLGFIFSAGHAFADAENVITEKDLKGYKKTADFVVPKQKTDSVRDAGQKISGRSDVGRDQEYYCKKGNAYRRKIDEAKFDVAQAKKKLDELKASTNIKASRVMRAEENIARKEKDLFRVERDLSDLENEAHRKDIPPGWLRCQF